MIHMTEGGTMINRKSINSIRQNKPSYVVKDLAPYVDG